MKAALVNKTTELVDNIIMVDSLNDPVDENHVLVEIDMIEKDMPEEERELYSIIQELDQTYYAEKMLLERPVQIGQTKWNATVGFYDEG